MSQNKSVFETEAGRSNRKNDEALELSETVGKSQEATPVISNKKRSRTEVDEEEDEPEPEQRKKQRRILALAKSRLSKWAARLFDPNRPRGLVEPPQEIPLNDEFLKAFGQREKQHDQAHGVSLTVETRIEDDDEKHESDMDIGSSNSSDDDTADPLVSSSTAAAASSSSTRKTPKAGRKVKITNLTYTTDQATLHKACSQFGVAEETTLIMDKDQPHLNAGRAYVLFEVEESAQACLDGLKQLEGRPLRVQLAAELPSAAGGGVTPATTNRARYWTRDISTKCYRCGQVGHIADNCTSEEVIVKPCPLCGNTDHDVRFCPNKTVCFNCGWPGHVSRDCRQPRGQPPRRICTLCHQLGHVKSVCRQIHQRGRPLPAAAVAQSAICMVCGETGHFSCQDMAVGSAAASNNNDYSHISCFNCGRTGHIGYHCDRPNLEVLSRNEGLAVQEVARTAMYSTNDHVPGMDDPPHRSMGSAVQSALSAPRQGRPGGGRGPNPGRGRGGGGANPGRGRGGGPPNRGFHRSNTFPQQQQRGRVGRTNSNNSQRSKSKSPPPPSGNRNRNKPASPPRGGNKQNKKRKSPPSGGKGGGNDSRKKQAKGNRK